MTFFSNAAPDYFSNYSLAFVSMFRITIGSLYDSLMVIRGSPRVGEWQLGQHGFAFLLHKLRGETLQSAASL